MTCAGYLLPAFLVGAFASFAWARLKLESLQAAHRAELDALRQALDLPHHPV